MEERGGEELRRLIEQSSEELHRKIDAHYARIHSILEGAQGTGARISIPPAGSREQRLKEVFIDAIAVLEETRKAFKSKQLQALRQRMTQVLMEAE